VLSEISSIKRAITELRIVLVRKANKDEIQDLTSINNQLATGLNSLLSIFPFLFNIK